MLDTSHGKPIGYRKIDTRPDGVERYLIQFEDGYVGCEHAHVSARRPYWHFGHSEEFQNPPLYDNTLTEWCVGRKVEITR